MTAIKTPAADAPAEECGRLAVSLPGWRWVRGMHDADARTFIEYADCGEAQWLWAADDGCEHLPVEGRLPDPDDPATAGCLLALLSADGRPVSATRMTPLSVTVWRHGLGTHTAPTLGRACIAAAAALGRWPGGEGERRVNKELNGGQNPV